MLPLRPTSRLHSTSYIAMPRRSLTRNAVALLRELRAWPVPRAILRNAGRVPRCARIVQLLLVHSVTTAVWMRVPRELSGGRLHRIIT